LARVTALILAVYFFCTVSSRRHWVQRRRSQHACKSVRGQWPGLGLAAKGLQREGRVQQRGGGGGWSRFFSGVSLEKKFVLSQSFNNLTCVCCWTPSPLSRHSRSHLGFFESGQWRNAGAANTYRPGEPTKEIRWCLRSGQGGREGGGGGGGNAVG
jgi:hypothetical protein